MKPITGIFFDPNRRTITQYQLGTLKLGYRQEIARLLGGDPETLFRLPSGDRFFVSSASHHYMNRQSGGFKVCGHLFVGKALVIGDGRCLKNAKTSLEEIKVQSEFIGADVFWSVFGRPAERSYSG